MPWLPFYASQNDLRDLLIYLNASAEVAFIVSQVRGKWIAVNSLPSVEHGRYCLWHIPSGPLPLERGPREKPGEIVDPFAGWSEIRVGADPSTPYFGAGHPGVFWLNVQSGEMLSAGLQVVGLSSFEWIGNHYRIIGSSAHPDTERYWKGLRRWVTKIAVRVPRGGPIKTEAAEIWALPGAQALFVSGAVGATGFSP
jgi:hypothetical protein